MERLQKEQLYLYLDICVCISHGCINVFLSIYLNICVCICILLEHLYFCICEGCINVFLSILAKQQIYPISLHPSPPMRPFPPPKAPKHPNKLVYYQRTSYLHLFFYPYSRSQAPLIYSNKIDGTDLIIQYVVCSSPEAYFHHSQIVFHLILYHFSSIQNYSLNHSSPSCVTKLFKKCWRFASLISVIV